MCSDCSARLPFTHQHSSSHSHVHTYTHTHIHSNHGRHTKRTALSAVAYLGHLVYVRDLHTQEYMDLLCTCVCVVCVCVHVGGGMPLMNLVCSVNIQWFRRIHTDVRMREQEVEGRVCVCVCVCVCVDGCLMSAIPAGQNTYKHTHIQPPTLTLTLTNTCIHIHLLYTDGLHHLWRLSLDCRHSLPGLPICL